MMEEISYGSLPEFDNHEMVVHLSDPEVGLEGYIAIHRRRHVHSLGATRLWAYSSQEEMLRDALRLARLMSYKSALAGLPYGGAKAALVATPTGLKNREKLFRSYARKVEELEGSFVTGTDVGVSNEDLEKMKQECQYIIGEGVNSAYFTAIGVVKGIQEALFKIQGSGNLEGKTFAIQGVGKTGSELLKLIYDQAAEIYISDINRARAEQIKNEFPKVQIVDAGEIHKKKVDIFAPCALSGSLNSVSLNELSCSIVAGSANNQLSTPEMGQKLFERSILYAPDYVINAGGLLSVADQFAHTVHDPDRIKSRLETVAQNLRAIFDRSIAEKLPTNVVADKIAEEIIEKSLLSETVV